MVRQSSRSSDSSLQFVLKNYQLDIKEVVEIDSESLVSIIIRSSLKRIEVIEWHSRLGIFRCVASDNQESGSERSGLYPNTLLLPSNFYQLVPILNSTSLIGFSAICRPVRPSSDTFSPVSKAEHQAMALTTYSNPLSFDPMMTLNLPVRFEVTSFTAKDFTKYSNTISLIKYNPATYLERTNQFQESLEDFFGQASVSFNTTPPTKVSQFSVSLKGNFVNGKNEVVLVQDNGPNSQSILTQIFERLCFALVDNYSVDNFLRCQSSFYARHPSLASLRPFDPESIPVNQLAGESNRKKPDTELRTCSNYGCAERFTNLENPMKCKGHTGTWDFGHTGKNTQEATDGSFVPLWKAHWTCCGKEWSSQCQRLHVHNSDPRKSPVDTSSPHDQIKFKKNIRRNWMFQLTKYIPESDAALRLKVDKFAVKLGKTAKVSLLDYPRGQPAQDV